MTRKIRPRYEQLVNAEVPVYDSLPASWTVDCEDFSDEKVLYDFQQEALQNGLRLLYQFSTYLDESGEYSTAKQRLFDDLDRYSDGYASDDELRLQKRDLGGVFPYLRERYPVQERSRYGTDYEEVDFEHLANRMGFWMATGSGKTVLAVKFVEVLNTLIERGAIPDRDILLLTHRDGILEQFEEEIAEYNQSHDPQIKTWSVDDYADVKRGGKIGTHNSINIFTYRSDNITDKTKDKEISFEDFENDGEWYVLLDEAHKGESSQSKRQAYYSMLSRNGFLFNFSATFTDPADILTTTYNYNIKEFTEDGYGKNVYISESDIHSITDDDFDETEKRKTVLKSLLALTLQKQAADSVDFEYHDPLLTAFVNSVNTTDSDLELFFQEIESIAKENRPDVFEEAKRELEQDLSARDTYAFSDDEAEWLNLNDLTKTDVLEAVFHSSTHADLEVHHSPDSKKELVFSLKTSSKPFALMRIGRKAGWLKQKLDDHEVEEEMDYQSYFENLNNRDSTINLLLGSRSFYEGWDSNRPNVMLFINLGKSDKRKFIMQAIGRGMRIEPRPDERQRLSTPPQDSGASRSEIRTLETLLVFGTSSDSLTSIAETIQEINDASYHDIDGVEASDDIPGEELLIPTYKEREVTHVRDLPQFPTKKEDVVRAWDWFGDDRLLFTYLSDLDYESLQLMREFRNGGTFGNQDGDGLDVLHEFQQHVNATRYKQDEFRPVNDDKDHIVHFDSIRADFEDEQDKAELEDAIEKVRQSGKETVDEQDLVEMIQSEKIDDGEAVSLMKEATKHGEQETLNEYGVTIQQIHSHFYSPVLYLDGDTESRFQHIIDVDSEVGFLKRLVNYDETEGLFDGVDWWKFSKLSERADDVYIPYSGDKKFRPDFIFWVCDGDEYKIIFVDPKSPNYSQALAKIDGYEDLFTADGDPVVFEHDGKKVSVHLRLFSKDSVHTNWGEYHDYWIHSIDDLDNLL